MSGRRVRWRADLKKMWVGQSLSFLPDRDEALYEHAYWISPLFLPARHGHCGRAFFRDAAHDPRPVCLNAHF